MPSRTTVSYANDHGSWAQVGDLVELLNPAGERLELFGLVQSEEHRPACTGPKRMLNILVNWNAGPSLESYRDCFVRIVSRG